MWEPWLGMGNGLRKRSGTLVGKQVQKEMDNLDFQKDSMTDLMMVLGKREQINWQLETSMQL